MSLLYDDASQVEESKLKDEMKIIVLVLLDVTFYVVESLTKVRISAIAMRQHISIFQTEITATCLSRKTTVQKNVLNNNAFFREILLYAVRINGFVGDFRIVTHLR